VADEYDGAQQPSMGPATPERLIQPPAPPKTDSTGGRTWPGSVSRGYGGGGAEEQEDDGCDDMDALDDSMDTGRSETTIQTTAVNLSTESLQVRTAIPKVFIPFYQKPLPKPSPS
jgi:hypothetical protein